MASALLVSNLLLWAVVLVLAVVVLALARQIGVLHERVAPAGALTLSGGLRPGEAVPPLELTDLDDGMIDLGSFARDGRGVLIFFLSPTCPVCKSLLPVVIRLAREERAWLDVLLASDGGELHEHRAYRAANALAGFPYVLSRDLGVALQVSSLPYAALVDEHGVLAAKGLVNTREHLESLLEARRLKVASINEYVARQANEERRA